MGEILEKVETWNWF